MALNIPMPSSSGESLFRGLDAGSALMSRIMQPMLERQRRQQMENHFQQQIALQKAAAARAGQNSDLQRQMMMEQLTGLHQKNEESKSLREWMQNRGGGDTSDNNFGMRALAKKYYGLDPLDETPEQKRQADLQSKIEFENAKTSNKKTALKDKELLAVEKDLPSLQNSLTGVDELLTIAKNNPDMFGHAFAPDLFAKTTNIKDFGRWQNLIANAVAGLEQKLSSKGNIVALKTALQLKPSHAEKLPVALGKLESMRKELQNSIARSRGILGKSNPMDLTKLSDEELMQMAGGG